MNPIIISEGRYFTKRVSAKGTRTRTFELYKDRIAIKDKEGEEIDTIQLKDIKNIKSGGFMWMGSLRFDYGPNSEYRVIQFIKTSFMLLGLIGILMSGGLKTAKLWKEELTKLGVVFNK